MNIVLEREQETILKGEYAEVCGQLGDLRKQRRIRRIEEYEKFMINCNIVRARMEVERLGMAREKRKRRNTVVTARRAKPEYVLLVRSCSLSYLDLIQSEAFTGEGGGSSSARVDRFSMPPLPDYSDRTF